MNNCCDTNVSNPISTNQICEVGILAPDCLNLCGNTLNDWLKALAEKQCECDWANFDLSPISDLIAQEPTTITECVVANALVEAINSLQTDVEDCCEEVLYNLSEEDWTPSRPLRALKKGKYVVLTGAAVANVSYTSDIANLPSDLYPSTNLYIPVAHDFAPSSSYNVFLRILPTGEIRLYFTGSAPSYGTARTVYLDGVTFFLD